MGTALAVQKSDLVALNPQSPEVEAMLYNIKMAGGVKDKDLRRVKNPSGGSVMFEIHSPGNTGEPEYTRELEGVVLAVVERRMLWKDKNVGTGELPVCSSKDMVSGRLRTKGEGDDKQLDIPTEILQVATPGGNDGLCAGCFFDTWGSAVDANGKPAKGKRCSEVRVVYLLQRGDILPVKMTIPPSSLGSWRQALLGLKFKIDKGGVIKLSLQSVKPKGGGPAFAQYHIESVAPLTPEAREGLEEYGKLLAAVFESTAAD